MKTYRDFSDNVNDVSQVEWTKFKIVVPTEEDKKEIQEAMKHCHNSRDIDTDFVTVNQMVHQYLDDGGCQIVVDKELFDSIENKFNV